MARLYFYGLILGFFALYEVSTMKERKARAQKWRDAVLSSDRVLTPVEIRALKPAPSSTQIWIGVGVAVAFLASLSLGSVRTILYSASGLDWCAAWVLIVVGVRLDQAFRKHTK